MIIEQACMIHAAISSVLFFGFSSPILPYCQVSVQHLIMAEIPAAFLQPE